MNATDHKCLDLARNEPEVTAGRLAQLTGLTTGAITAVLDRLEHAGFIRRERDRADRRRVIVRALPAAHQKLAPYFADFRRALASIHADYTAAELALLEECVVQQTSLAPLIGVPPEHAYGRWFGVNWVY